MYNLFVDSSTSISFEVEYDFQRSNYLSESSHTTRTGRKYSYIWAEIERVAFSVRFVDSATASIVNSWWAVKANLFFQESGSGQTMACQIVNDETPIGEFEKPYTTLFKGELELESY